MKWAAVGEMTAELGQAGHGSHPETQIADMAPESAHKIAGSVTNAIARAKDGDFAQGMLPLDIVVHKRGVQN
jgi:hypothetical protein